MEKKNDIRALAQKNRWVDQDLLKRYAELARQIPNRKVRTGAAFNLKRAFSERALEPTQGRRTWKNWER